MKTQKRLLLKLMTVILLALLPYLVYSQDKAAKFNYKINDKSFIQVEACNNSIFRVRTSPDGNFDQSLMERYGIVRETWSVVSATENIKGNIVEISTDSLTLRLDRNTGKLSLSRKDGEILISSITPAIDEGEERALISSLTELLDRDKRDISVIIGDVTKTENQTGSNDILSENIITGFELKPVERFYGLGGANRRRIQHRGHASKIWTQYQKAEAPVPFIMSSEGWGVFNNTTAKHYFDVGRFDKNRMFITNPSGKADLYIIAGNSMQNVLFNYTEITGRSFLLPRYAYGLAFGGNMMENMLNMMDNAMRFREHEIPCDLMWIEPQWMGKYYDFSTAKTWNFDSYPGEGYWEKNNKRKRENSHLFISKLHKLGFKLALWLCIDHDFSIAEEDKLALAKGDSISGQEHWFDHLTNFVDQGVDGFKLDPAGTIFEHANRDYYNGYTDMEMHNMNQVLLTKQMNLTFRNHKGTRPFHHYCGGYAGTQHWGASTCGDNGGGIDALYDQINLGSSGFLNTSADVDVNKAGLHFGFFLPWVQVNSWYSLSHPWYLNKVDKDAFYYYARLRNMLSPYIYSTAINGHLTGMPILRSMALIYPDDRNVDNMSSQFMFGENMLITAFSDSIYLPAGNWINFWNGEKVKGGEKKRFQIPSDRGGLAFVKGGAVIPMKNISQYVNEHPLDTIILKVYPDGKSSYTLLEDDGISFDYEKGNISKIRIESIQSGNNIKLIINPREGSWKGMPSSRTWQVVMAASSKPKKVSLNGTIIKNWNYDKKGTLTITVDQKNMSGREEISIVL